MENEETKSISFFCFLSINKDCLRYKYANVLERRKSLSDSSLVNYSEVVREIKDHWINMEPNDNGPNFTKAQNFLKFSSNKEIFHDFLNCLKNDVSECGEQIKNLLGALDQFTEFIKKEFDFKKNYSEPISLNQSPPNQYQIFLKEEAAQGYSVNPLKFYDNCSFGDQKNIKKGEEDVFYNKEMKNNVGRTILEEQKFKGLEPKLEIGSVINKVISKANSRQTSNYQENLIELKKNYEEIQAERNDLKNTLIEKENDAMKIIDDLTIENDNYKIEITRLKNFFGQSLSNENKNFKKKLEEIEQIKKKLEEENIVLKKEITEERTIKEEERRNLTKRNNELKEEVIKKNISIELLQKDINKQKAEIDTWEEVVNIKSQENFKLTEEIDRSYKSCSELQQRFQNNAKELMSLKNAEIAKNLHEKIKNLEYEGIKFRNDFQQKIDDLNKALKEKTEEVVNNRQISDQIFEENTKLVNIVKELTQKLDNNEYNIKIFDEKPLRNPNPQCFNQEVKKFNQNTNQQSLESQAKYEQLENEKNALHKNFIEKTNELIKHQHFINFLKKEHLVHKDFLERKVNDLIIQIDALEKFYNDENNALKKQIEKLNIDIDNQKNLYKEAKKKLIIQENESTQLKMNINELTMEKTDLESQLIKLTEKIKEKRKEVKSLNNDLDPLKSENESLESENKSLNIKLEETESQVSSLEKKLKKTSLEMNRIKYRLNLVPNPDENSIRKSKIKMPVQNPNPYDLILNIDSLKTTSYKNGWEITDFTSKTQKKESHTIVGIVGRENIGKTFILNKLCGFDLPSGANVNTKGLSLKYSLQDGGLLCLDSAGIQTPVYYYDNKLMERFGTNKEDLKKNEEIRRQMINDRTITDIFIQDFILEVAEVIIIVVGQLSQNDQKFIERIASKYKAKKRIIIIHNFSNLYSVEDVENKIKRDIIQAYDTQDRFIPESDDVKEYIEKINDKNKENIIHLVLGVEWTESGQKYNESTFRYLQHILYTRVDKKQFDLFSQLGEFLQDNYRLYLKFLKRLETPLVLKREKDKMYIKCDENFEISNPIFNSLGNLVSNPPFEVFEKENKYIVLVEIPDLEKEPNIKFEIKKKLNEFNNLLITGLKSFANHHEEDNNLNTISFRNYGEFKCLIPLGPNYLRIKPPKNEDYNYKKGVLKLEVEKLSMEEIMEL